MHSGEHNNSYILKENRNSIKLGSTHFPGTSIHGWHILCGCNQLSFSITYNYISGVLNDDVTEYSNPGGLILNILRMSKQ